MCNSAEKLDFFFFFFAGLRFRRPHGSAGRLRGRLNTASSGLGPGGERAGAAGLRGGGTPAGDAGGYPGGGDGHRDPAAPLRPAPRPALCPRPLGAGRSPGVAPPPAR